ncbi:Holliday junction ATP-dependent DNA helicase RuvA [Candidatus Syntrophocurvum alkaliphilum]|uniref:Holliday junction branch migration complex subunit RuvA n=1 Tax=Candidatus Syntrophocurvum alkaliphilum TaxID=2293317 RepID=A0A6I6DB63_9FIRM|nr:Holliday junction branch migration protein RuvA [Candidatus Syntrophocurvum alkaliphilum]QGT99915.1 Holliday junction ATP-dependent DNA helicase RuvA [Candidatus Syntrophocurvum alkaliphilum]
MISFLRGELYALNTETVTIEVNGVGYEVYIPNVNQLSVNLGKEVLIHTYLQVLDNEFKLYGFENKEDLELFKLLISVSGIGAKAALNVLGTINPINFYNAIMSSDEKTLTKIPGIGKKSAQRIIFELKDKLKNHEMPTVKQNDQKVKQDEELIEAMETLGYSRSEVYPVIVKMEKAGELSGDIQKDLKVVLRNIANKVL